MLRYYVAVAPALVPHFRERPVVLTRYPDGAGTTGFYVQHAPEQRPAWIQTCTTSVKPPKVMNYLTIDTIAARAWIANLGAIEMHPWYSRCTAPTLHDGVSRCQPAARPSAARLQPERAWAHVGQSLLGAFDPACHDVCAS